eukprot:1834616-Rhodomonas_salina.3
MCYGPRTVEHVWKRVRLLNMSGSACDRSLRRSYGATTVSAPAAAASAGTMRQTRRRDLPG